MQLIRISDKRFVNLAHVTRQADDDGKVRLRFDVYEATLDEQETERFIDELEKLDSCQ